MAIAIISHPDCLLHAIEGHPEQPDRVSRIQAALKESPCLASLQFLDAPLATREELIRAHQEDYVDWIAQIAPQNNFLAIDADTIMNPYTLQAAKRAAGALIMAVDLVVPKKMDRAFCNVRPPGHHAEFNKAMGFCFFNNVAVGVHHALAQYGFQRIAIIDFDVHHGNGTQNIFQNDERVLYCSSFQHPFYPGYDASLDNSHILSVPLAENTEGLAFRERVAAAWFNPLATFKPEIIFISAGFDAHRDDPLASLKLEKEDYVWITKELLAIAKTHSEGRIISALEGGYHLPALAECAVAHVCALV
ncbi:MAG: histone deacetylase family protein [Gammaproteobacteria bacterium]|nr:histone deacetylase family protein [Gammaproteobacteria bacterium]